MVKEMNLENLMQVYIEKHKSLGQNMVPWEGLYGTERQLIDRFVEIYSKILRSIK